MNENRSPIESFPDETSGEHESEPPESGVALSLADQQSTLTVNASQLKAAVRSVIQKSPYNSGSVSIAVVDDPTIHEINRQYLEHDYPTDVLSFVLEDRPPYLEGELIVSTDTAAQNAAEYGWPAHNELLLYVIHGSLHLVGYRDKELGDIADMRAAELLHLRELGLGPPDSDPRWADDVTEGEAPPS